ncbi:hypothetical protein NJB14191_09310 [Mycobacterium montefiorense]|nr:hypothetical protein NJB14191_09310 [Mycobacterium montefiorense]GKU39522.1 hypothetical protein NJB14192_15150 [Mycobacterium montefiorense]GKU63461.1 hypothetical protein NJB18182_39610 [Mycobacterium montefiorense]GKU68051.1 hypothetical protein NJB18183_31970 [Mycobacterium montefiorense]
MFFLRTSNPRQPVEEQLVVVARIESAQLGTGAMQNRHPQRAYLGIGAQFDNTHALNRSRGNHGRRVTPRGTLVARRVPINRTNVR